MMNKITVETTINSPMAKVWDAWTKPEHVTKWTFASDDWEAPFAEIDLKVGGKFTTRMQAKDKSVGFDFGGVYTAVKEHELIEYEMEDGRQVSIVFSEADGKVKVVETFVAERSNSEELQRSGWQAILNNFKSYVENS